MLGAAVQSDGKALVVGTITGGWAVARLTNGGVYDSTFESGSQRGLLTLPVNAGGPSSVAVQDDGKILVLGNDNDGNGVIARLNPGGTPDPSIGPNGLRKLGAATIPTAVVVQPDHKIVFTAVTGTSDDNARVVRLNPDGSPDASFGTGGATRVVFPGTATGLNALALQPDGKIVAFGNNSADMAVVVSSRVASSTPR